MTLSEQLTKVKENWLILLVVILIVLIMSNFSIGNVQNYVKAGAGIGGVTSDIAVGRYDESNTYPPIVREDDFAPSVENRLITKTASVGLEVKRGQLDDRTLDLKKIVKSNNGLILYENEYESEYQKVVTKSANYRIKIDSDRYDNLINELKKMGEVKSFSENLDDITGRVLSLERELEIERNRLITLKNLQKEAKSVAEKISITDRIFQIERTIGYYEEAVERQRNKVSYSTIQVTLNEKKSQFVGIVFVTFGELVRSFVNSVNQILKLGFVMVPYLVTVLILVFFYRKFKK